MKNLHALALALAALVLPVAAIPSDSIATPLGTVIDVGADSSTPSVGRAARGDIVMAWSMGSQLDGLQRYCIQRFGPDGASKAPQACTLEAGMTAASVAVATDGHFFVIWATACGAGCGDVRAQRYTVVGKAQGHPIEVQPGGCSHESCNRVAGTFDGAGNLILAWSQVSQDFTSNEIRMRRFSAAGAALGDATLVAQAYFTLDDMGGEDPSSVSGLGVAADAVGNFVLTWGYCHGQAGHQGCNADVYFQRYDSTGAAAGGIVNATNDTPETNYNESNPEVAMLGDGEFAMAWDNGDLGIELRRFGADGAPVADETVVIASFYPYHFTVPQLAMDATGRVVVAATASNGETGAISYVARLLDASGNALTDVFDVAATPVRQDEGDVAMDADGDVIAVWKSHEADNHLYVLGQRFSGPEDVNLSVAVADRGDPIEQGALMKYVVKLTNHHAAGATPGFGNATSVTASLALPAGLDFVAASGRHWNCSGTGPVSCLYDVALAPGAVSSPLSLEGVSPGSTNAKKVTATLAADQFDSVTADNSASRTTHVTPSSGAFGFTDLAGAAIGTLLKSNVVTLSGLAGVTPISIASTPGGHGATYSVNGGAFTSAPGSVAPGDQLRLRVRSASAASTAVNVVVDVGGLTEPWDVVTAAAGP